MRDCARCTYAKDHPVHTTPNFESAAGVIYHKLVPIQTPASEPTRDGADVGSRSPLQTPASEREPWHCPPVAHDREVLGRIVRRAWVEWAREQPNPKASWLVPYEELSEADKDADCRIGEAVQQFIVDASLQAWKRAQPEGPRCRKCVMTPSEHTHCALQDGHDGQCQPEGLRKHVLYCDEYHQHVAPKCCDAKCWCKTETAQDLI